MTVIANLALIALLLIDPEGSGGNYESASDTDARLIIEIGLGHRPSQVLCSVRCSTLMFIIITFL